MSGLPIPDSLVVVAYLAATVVIGYFTRSRTTTSEGYFLGGRRFGRWIQTLASFGQMTTADGPVGVATTTFRNGAAGIWSSLLMVFAAPIFWITSAWMRRMRLLTMGDFYARRYGSERMAATYAIIASLGMMGTLAGGYVAFTKTMVGMLLTPLSMVPAISPTLILAAICLATVLNAVMGGLTASFCADVMRSSLILILSVLLIPFAWVRINSIHGGSGFGAAWSTLHAHLPAAFFEVFGSSQLPDFTWYYLLAVSAIAGISVVTQPNQFVTSAAASNESVARFGAVGGAFLKRLCTILWAIGGLFAVGLYSGKLRDSDLVWGYATRDLLGPAGLGLVGLMLAGLMAAVMSASNSVALAVAGLVTYNLYRPLRPGRPEAHYIAVGRIAAAIFLISSGVLALQFNGLFEIMKFGWEFFAIFGGAFWLGMKWRRATREGAWASILVTFAFFYLLPCILPMLWPSLRTSFSQSIFWSQGITAEAGGTPVGHGMLYLDLVALHELGVSFGHLHYALVETIRIGIQLFLPFAILIVVSTCTPRADPRILDQFFLPMRTPVRSGEAPDGPPGPGLDSRLFPRSDWEFYRWSWSDVAGFASSLAVMLVVLAILVVLF